MISLKKCIVIQLVVVVKSLATFSSHDGKLQDGDGQVERVWNRVFLQGKPCLLAVLLLLSTCLEPSSRSREYVNIKSVSKLF